MFQGINSGHVFKNQLNKINKLLRFLIIVMTPKRWRITTKLQDGVIVSGKNIPGYGGRGIYLERDNIEPEFIYLKEFIGTGDVFVDVGANTGIYSLRAAKLVADSGVVISLEPNPEMLAELFYNVNKNGYKNVRLRGLCAAGSSAADLFWTNFGKPNSFSLLKREENAMPFSVLKITLDELFILEGVNKCEYIKIDAEGAEEEIIKGSINIIKKYRPIIQAEVHLSSIDKNLLEEYSGYQLKENDGTCSPNLVFIPNESNKNKIAIRLGFVKI